MNYTNGENKNAQKPNTQIIVLKPEDLAEPDPVWKTNDNQGISVVSKSC